MANMSAGKQQQKSTAATIYASRCSMCPVHLHEALHALFVGQ
jgi:hypothetical protein